MLFTKSMLKKYKLSMAIILYIVGFYIINSNKPNIFYNPDGSLKQFGIGYKHKTVVPLWLVVIFLAIFCYLALIYYILNPKIS